MSTAQRWTKSAILARLAASDAIDRDTSRTPRERAERRIELLRVASALEAGTVNAATAEAVFVGIADELKTAPVASAEAVPA